MTKYLITFGPGAMDRVPAEEMPAVAAAAHAVCQEALDAGVLVLAGGLADRPGSVVSPDGTVAVEPTPSPVSGITVVDVPGRDDALSWAARLAVACRCAQEVREIGSDPALDAMQA